MLGAEGTMLRVPGDYRTASDSGSGAEFSIGAGLGSIGLTSRKLWTCRWTPWTLWLRFARRLVRVYTTWTPRST